MLERYCCKVACNPSSLSHNTFGVYYRVCVCVCVCARVLSERFARDAIVHETDVHRAVCTSSSTVSNTSFHRMSFQFRYYYYYYYFIFIFTFAVEFLTNVYVFSLSPLSLSLSLSLKTKRKFSKRQRKNVRSVPREVFQYNSITHQVPFSLSKARRSGVFVALETIHDPR